MSSRSRRLALAIAFLFTLSLAAGAADAQKRTPQKPQRADQQKQIKATPPGGNGGGNGGGKGGGGNDGGSSAYAVDVALNGGVEGPTVAGHIDEGYSNGHLGARMEAPPTGSGIVPVTIHFQNVATEPDTISCSTFFDIYGADGVGDNTVTFTDDGNGNITGGVWSGLSYVRASFTADAPDGATWEGLGEGDTHAVASRVNGFSRVTETITRGKKTREEITTTNLFSLRFDTRWQPGSSEAQAVYDALDAGNQIADLEATAGADSDGDGTADSWLVTNGSGGTIALIHPIDNVDGALCDVQVNWSIARQ